MTPSAPARTHSSHWGAFTASRENGQLRIEPWKTDPDPSPILRNLPAALDSSARVLHPMVRRGWLERGPGPDSARGRDEFVQLGWDEALDLVAREMRRVRTEHGGESIFAGSYGWASAGLFHCAQNHLHRFLNLQGGYVRSVNSYSAGAATVILPRVLGTDWHASRNVTWPTVAAHTDIVVAFGGMAIKNNFVGGGGVSKHLVRDFLAQGRRRGTRFFLVSPLRDDFPPEADSEWLPITPGTDVALMLGLAHTLVARNLHDTAFLEKCCEGFPAFENYLRGGEDGIVKDAAWASALTGLPAARIEELACLMAGRRTLITVSQSLQRAEHGEQPVWMGIVLAAMLGQLGLPGGGFIYGIGSMANMGMPAIRIPLQGIPKLKSAIRTFIPVARISDLLLHPGQTYDYDGQKLTYPDIRLVYWVGGNPFHHHQDINRLRRAFARPDTIITHECNWTATARHADIVLPCTVTMERHDIGGSGNDDILIAMHRLAEPRGEARDDYAIFSALAARLGLGHEYTEGRTAADWLRHIYGEMRAAILAQGGDAPDFDTFWDRGELTLPLVEDIGGPLAEFRADPAAFPLKTPSGKVEITSSTIAGFGYDDCPGHPAWLAPLEGRATPAAERFPLFLISNQPATRLHSQLDYGACSQASKVQGREPVRLHPRDAAARGIKDGDVVRLFNDRGACLAGAVLSEDVSPGVIQLSTGAWYDPADPHAEAPLCVHGNPNVLTRDAGSSRLAQGSIGQLTLVEMERFAGPLPPIRAFTPPRAVAAPALEPVA